jgi:hypothetical protein
MRGVGSREFFILHSSFFIRPPNPTQSDLIQPIRAILSEVESLPVSPQAAFFELVMNI